MENEFAAGYSQASPTMPLPKSGTVRVDKNLSTGAPALVLDQTDENIPMGGGLSVPVAKASLAADVQASLGRADGYLGVYTWTGKPSASGNAGKIITIQQGGLVGQYLSDGTDWVPLGRVALGANGAPGTTTGGTTETVLASWLLPGKALSPAGRFELFAALQYTNSAGNKNLNLRLGGTGVNGSVLWTHTVTTTRKILMRTGFMSRNGYAAQIGTATDYSPGYATITTDILTSAVDMTVNQTVYLTAQCDVGTDLVTLQACSAEII